MLPLLSLERPLACGVVAGREVLPHSAQQQQQRPLHGQGSAEKAAAENRVAASAGISAGFFTDDDSTLAGIGGG